MSIFRLFSIAGLGLILVFSLIPGDLQIRTPLPKTVEHFTAYFAVALVLAIGRVRTRHAVAVAVLLSGLAGLMEFFQDLVPGRDAHILDFLASGFGAAAGASAAHLLNQSGVGGRLLARMGLRGRELSGR